MIASYSGPATYELSMPQTPQYLLTNASKSLNNSSNDS